MFETQLAAAHEARSELLALSSRSVARVNRFDVNSTADFAARVATRQVEFPLETLPEAEAAVQAEMEAELAAITAQLADASAFISAQLELIYPENP